MSVEVKAPATSMSSAPGRSLGGGIKATERGQGLGSSFKPMISISKEGVISKGDAMTKIKPTIQPREVKTSFTPLISINKDGKMTEHEGLSTIKKASGREARPAMPQFVPYVAKPESISRDTHQKESLANLQVEARSRSADPVKTHTEKIAPKAEFPSSYRPLVAISHSGELTKMGTLDKPKDPSVVTQATAVVKDTLSHLPKRYLDKDIGTLYQRSAMGEATEQTLGEKTTPERIAKTSEIVDIRNVQPSFGGGVRKSSGQIPSLSVTPDKEGVLQEKIASQPTIMREATPIRTSPWEKKQATLISKREKAQAYTLPVASTATAQRSINQTKPDVFAEALMRKVAKNQIITSPTINRKQITAPDALDALSTRVQALRDVLPHASTTTISQTEKRVQQVVEPSLMRSVRQKGMTHVLESAPQSARIEIETIVQDGALVAQKMTQILMSQGVEKNVAEEKALEQTTKTIVKTLHAKGLALHLETAINEEKQKAQENKQQQMPDDEELEEKRETTGMITAVRDHVADIHRVRAVRDIGVELLAMAQNAGQNSIDLAAVSDLMPDQPGESLASFIRTQLKLHLNSEEQYDAFNDTLSKMGEVSSEQEIIDAAIYATDMAPAVRLAKGEAGEKVTPFDVDSALRNGNHIRKLVRIIKQTVTATFQTVQSSV